VAKEFLGTGFSFPVQVNERGGVATASEEEKIRQSILLIISTARGERVMRPDFGCGIHSLVFSVVNSSTITLVRSSVHEALLQWEPRIDVIDIEISTTSLDEGALLISVDYRVRSTNTEQNLVYPFYLRGGA
jgi:phage baseplate assembly protein W